MQSRWDDKQAAAYRERYGERDQNGLQLEVAERGKVLSRDAIGHQVVVRPSSGEEEAAATRSRRRSFHHDVRVGHAHGDGAADHRRSIAGVDEEQ